MNRREVVTTLAALVAAAPLIEVASGDASATEAPTAGGWSLSGSYFEACSCETVCPCIFESAPSHGDCDVLYAWRIDKGSDGAVSLDGLNVAIAPHAGGHMQKVKWLAALYIDDRATAEQHSALERIYTGKAGGHPAALASFFERFLGVKSVPIDYQYEGRKRSVFIPGVMRAAFEAIKGQGGAETTVTAQPLALAPGNPLVVARSGEVLLTDYDWNWKFSGRAGGYSPFQYRSA
ncbi:DUF1326 domain-containing protein [Hyphomicrobium sp. NDB2Meth4]|uniref:DUF1326 domain-containing protein n=1 Tax=Hyphomicrobium sp. NDB2Meth4 TaxID=1892846 RepID=UPI0009FA743F|nr:DUF1326 domain-containing protein [Hyphomicrobium sp. NDB2Meth4]